MSGSRPNAVSTRLTATLVALALGACCAQGPTTRDARELRSVPATSIEQRPLPGNHFAFVFCAEATCLPHTPKHLARPEAAASARSR